MEGNEIQLIQGVQDGGALRTKPEMELTSCHYFVNFNHFVGRMTGEDDLV